MDQKTFSILCEQTVRDTSALLISKGEEYAGSSDRLANFKRGASLTGATPLQVAFIYASKHYDSISTYVKKDASGYRQILSEPIEERFNDLINYCMLMKALIVDETPLRPHQKTVADHISERKEPEEPEDPHISTDRPY